MKKLITLVSLLLIAVSFQNCGQNMLAAEGQNLQDGSPLKKFEDGGKDPYVESKTEIAILQLLAYQKIKIHFTGKDRAQYAVDLEQRKYAKVTATSNELLCLPLASQQRFEKALKAAQICEQNKAALNPDLACTAIYAYPYASLETQGTKIELGEQTSGCTWVQDLCGDQRQTLKDAIAHLQTLRGTQCPDGLYTTAD